MEPNRWRMDHLLLLLLSASISLLWGGVVYANGGQIDFKAVYYGARCLIEHHDPYNPKQLLSVYQNEDGEFPSDPARDRVYRSGLLVCINLPTTLLMAAPVALLGFGPARMLWMALIAGLFTIATLMMWRQGRSYAPRLSLLLAAMIAANTELLYILGNTAGIIVGLCVIAAWCLLNERHARLGTLCLALALAMKPHDAWLVWLCFVLMGGMQRRRALQALAIVAALTIPAVLWVSHVAPQWTSELHANVLAGAAPGGVNAPGPAAGGGRDADMVIDLQSAIYVFSHRPIVANTISYLVCGALVLVLILRALGARASRPDPWLGLAAAVAPTVLVTYHRCYDAKLLLLAIPACAMLWSRGGATKWLAVALTAAGALFTADVPLNVFLILTKNLPMGLSGIWGKTLAVVLLEPTPLVLLAMGVFYSWVYWKGGAACRASTGPERLIEAPLAVDGR